MSEDYHEKQLKIEQRARLIITEQLINQMMTETHEHRDQMNETDSWHNEQKEKLCDHIEDLQRYIKKLEEKIVEANGVVETTDCPYLDISEMKPVRILAYR